MAKPLVDLLWRTHPDAPRPGARGPRPSHTVSDVVTCAMALADASGLAAVTIRALAQALAMSTMSIYTHLNSRDDLLALMADTAHGTLSLPAFGRTGWRARVRRVADANLQLLTVHRWLLDIRDPRVALGPGTIAKYDHELHAFDGTRLDDLSRDAALTLVLDFVRANAAARGADADGFGPVWAQSAARLGHYVGASYPLARRVGQAAGEAMGAPYSPARGWEFGLERVIAGLEGIC